MEDRTLTNTQFCIARAIQDDPRNFRLNPTAPALTRTTEASFTGQPVQVYELQCPAFGCCETFHARSPQRVKRLLSQHHRQKHEPSDAELDRRALAMKENPCEP